ncbi:MAG: AI-2E family transporter [Anaerolineales bacterium]|nr:AI-2E family transporter [Anaerolineales bacterium]
MNTEPSTTSPKWGSTTKLVVALTIVAILALLFIQFRNIIGPLLLAFILSFVLYPLAARLSKLLKVSWRAAVNLIYLLLVILLLTSFTLTGLAVVQQLQSLIGFVQRYVTDLPGMVDQLSKLTYQIGPFELSLGQFDLQWLTNQLLSAVQPILGRAGSLISTFATSAAATVGWGLFVVLISYFLLAESGKVPNQLIQFDLPGYHADIRRLNQELMKIWDTFLRGQLIIILLVMIAYSALMMILGVRFALGIAILAGLGRFVPYIGPAILWIVTTLVALFQGGNYFGLQPGYYALLVLVSAFVLDQIFDNLVTPRLLGKSLGVHPAAVLIAAIVAAKLIGLIGLILAAPVVATLKLVGVYVLRKMLDLDPWSAAAVEPEPPPNSWRRMRQRVQEAWSALKRRKV